MVYPDQPTKRLSPRNSLTKPTIVIGHLLPEKKLQISTGQANQYKCPFEILMFDCNVLSFWPHLFSWLTFGNWSTTAVSPHLLQKVTNLWLASVSIYQKPGKETADTTIIFHRLKNSNVLQFPETRSHFPYLSQELSAVQRFECRK